MLNYVLNNRVLLVYIIPFLLGSITVFSFQPFNLTIINFLSLPLLFFILSNINKRSKNTFRKKPFLINFFYVGYSFGIGFFLAGTYWISNSLTFDESFRNFIPLTIIIIPLALGIFFGLGTLVFSKYFKFDFASLLLFCFMISIIDYFRSTILTGFPWNLWAYSWSWFVEMIQILNPLGLFAFNLLSITFFCLPALIFMKKFKFRFLIIFLASIIVFCNYLYGNFIINNNKIEIQEIIKDEKFINIKVVSPNFKLKYNLSDNEIEDRLKKLIKYSDANKQKKTLFIWPEGALSGKYFFEIKKYKKLLESSFSENHRIVLGTNYLEKKGGKTYNSFLIIDHKFNILFRYNKIKLVPFGEFVPFSPLLNKIGFKKITEGVGSFTSGETRSRYSYGDLSILPLICYEIIFPDLVQNIFNKNNLLINISEDAWFGDSIGPSQHFSKSIFRAVESNSFMIRSANKGISAVVNNKGQIIKTLKNNESGYIEYKLPLLQKKAGIKNDLIFFILLFTYWVVFLILKKND